MNSRLTKSRGMWRTGLINLTGKVGVVYTTPLKYEPVEVFLSRGTVSYVEED